LKIERATTGRKVTIEERAGEGEEREELQRLAMPDETKAVLHLVEEAPLLVASPSHLRRSDEHQRDDHGDEGESVQAEADRGAEGGQCDAGEDRADHAREVELHRVHRHRVRYVLALHQQRQ
jgi:hypothetical protein